MSISDDYINGVGDFFSGEYTTPNAQKIPTISDLAFGKTGKLIELAMVFVDIRESTKIVDGFRRVTAARMYKSFLWGVTKIIKANGGQLKSFNGDGMLAVFHGDTKCSSSVRAAFQINWFVTHALRPKMEQYFSRNNKLADMSFNFGLGIDVGEILVVRGGIKGEDNSDLVWVGNATNYSVKLSDLASSSTPIYITNSVYNRLISDVKKRLNGEETIWEKRYWTKKDNQLIYRTDYWRKP